MRLEDDEEELPRIPHPAQVLNELERASQAPRVALSDHIWYTHTLAPRGWRTWPRAGEEHGTCGATARTTSSARSATPRCGSDTRKWLRRHIARWPGAGNRIAP